MALEYETTVTIRWSLNEDTNDHHKKRLDQHGIERASEMIQDKYVEGELHHTLTGEDDEDVHYSGWWHINTGRNK